MKLYYGPGACSFAPHAVLEEIGAPYEGVKLDLSKGEQHRPEHLALNPMGRVPVLVDGPLVLSEVGAILQYLTDKYPKAGLFPEDIAEKALARRWLAWLSSALHVAFALNFRTSRYTVEEAHYDGIRAAGRAMVADLFSQAEGQITGQYLVGERYSVLEAYLLVFYRWSFTLELPMARDCPKITAICEQTLTRPAIIRTMEQEGITKTGRKG